MIITKDNLQGITKLKQSFNKQFEMNDLRHLSYFLGLKVSSDSFDY